MSFSDLLTALRGLSDLAWITIIGIAIIIILIAVMWFDLKEIIRRVMRNENFQSTENGKPVNHRYTKKPSE